MKVLYYDCFCGISGDMNLAALLDLGVPKEYLIKEVAKLHLEDEYEIKIEKASKLGITGTRVDVLLRNKESNKQLGENHHYKHIEADINNHNQKYIHEKNHGHEHEGDPVHEHKHEHEHEHDHDHEHDHTHEWMHEHGQNHDHSEEKNHVHVSKHSHHHRNLKDIEDIINSSTLSDKVKKLSLNMFMKVAEAEAKVHGKDLYEIHFHEVGATDSIVDIVGGAICLDYLGVDKIMASPVQVGGGFVKCAHGLMPVPAPATVEILKGIPVNSGLVAFETTTPTGAAVLAANVQEFTPKIDFEISKVAYGIGHKDLEIPNVLRVYLGEQEQLEQKEIQYIFETNIDDMNPEFYGYVEEKLFEAGALDVFKTPIFMKKGRPGIKLSILAAEKSERAVLDIIFEETTSIGIRKYKVDKIMLSRDFEKVQTQYGEITIKRCYHKGRCVKYKPEYEECRKAALHHNISLESIYKEIHKIVGDQDGK